MGFEQLASYSSTRGWTTPGSSRATGPTTSLDNARLRAPSTITAAGPVTSSRERAGFSIERPDFNAGVNQLASAFNYLQPASNRSTAVANQQSQEIALQAAEILGKGPGFIMERPLAVVNTALKNNEGKGPIDLLADTLGDVPLLGGALSLGSEVFGNISRFPAALVNWDTARLLREYYGKPDSTPLGGALGFQLPNQSWKTIGDVRRDAIIRGWTPQDMEDLATGKKSDWDFGNKMMSNDPIVDIGASLLLDPLNLLLGAGLITKAASGAGMVARLISGGRLATQAAAPSAGAALLAAGAPTAAAAMTDASLASYLARGAAYYQKAAIATSVANLVGVAIEDKVPNVGPLQGLLEFNRAVFENRPLSNSVAFDFFAALTFPWKETTAAAVKPLAKARGSIRHNALTRSMADLMPKLDDAQRTDLLYYALARYEFKRINPATRDALAQAENLNERLMKNDLLALAVNERVRRGLAVGRYTARDVEQEVKEWFTWRRVGKGDEHTLNQTAFPWQADDAADLWVRWSEHVTPAKEAAQTRLADVLGGDPYPLIGFGHTRSLSREHLLVIKDLFDDVKGNDLIDITRVRSALSEYPQLLRMEPWFERHLVEGAGGVRARDLRKHLNKMIQDAPSLRDYARETTTWERGAPPDPEVIMAQVAEEEAGIGVSRWAANRGGFGVLESIDAAMTARSHPAAVAARTNIVDVLTESGYTVDEIADAIGAWMENAAKTKEPSLHLTLNGASLEELRQIGASLVGPWEQYSTIHYVTGAGLARRGLQPNGVVIRIAVPTDDPAILTRLSDMVDSAFPGYELIESNGLFTIVQHRNWFDNDIETLSARVEALVKALSDEFPKNNLGQTGVLHSLQAAYVESVVSQGATNAEQIAARTVLRSAAADPRVAALRTLVRERTLPQRQGVVGVGVDGAVGDPALVGRGGPDGPVAPAVTRENLQAKLDALGLFTPDQTRDISDITDAMFRTLARDLGIPVEEFYTTYLGDIVKGGEGVSGLLQVGPGSKPPTWMVEEGLGKYSKDVPVVIADRTYHIPGGLDGTFSVWDAIKLRAQKIDANWLWENDPDFAVQLYNKMFRSMQRDLGDPMETFHLVTFALMSPRTDFIVNEARTVLAKMRTPQEIVAFANKYLPEGAPTELTARQISAIGKRVVEDLGVYGVQGRWNVKVSFRLGDKTFNKNIQVPYSIAGTKEAAEARAIEIAQQGIRPRRVRPKDETVEYVPVEELRKYARHNREGGGKRFPEDDTIDVLAADMAKNGFDKTRPIALVYDSHNGRVWIADGHHRLAAAIRAGVKEVPVFVRNHPMTGTKRASWMRPSPIRPAGELAMDFGPSKLGIGLPERVSVDAKFSGGELQGLAEHYGNLALAARVFRDNPDLFTKAADMPINQFADRLMNITRGAGLKVGTFGPMLADPLGATRGTIDVWMVRYINSYIRRNKALLERIERERGYDPGYLTTELRLNAREEPIIPQARRVKATNQAVPEHLRDMADSKGQVQIFEGSEYERANHILRVDYEAFKAAHPEAEFDLGGYQWFVWDRARGGRLEPHVAAYPGTYAASRPPLSGGPGAQHVRPDIVSMMAELKAGGMSNVKKGVEGYEMRPELMTLFQGGDVIKGMTQFNESGQAIIRFYEAADVSTALHEVFHAARRGMTAERRAELERLFNVRDGEWTVELEENAARAFERFVRAGEVTNPELQGVFTRMREWMTAIYQLLRGSPLGRSLSPQKKAFFDSLFGTLDDRSSFQRVGVGAPRDAAPEAGFLYRAASTEDLIRLRGDLLRPEYGPSGSWPSGVPGDVPTNRRLYWTDSPTALESDAVLRVSEQMVGRVRGQSGDFYTVKPVRSTVIEVLGGDGQWYPLDSFMTSPLGDVGAELQEAAQRWAVYFDGLPVAMRPSTEAGALRLVNDEAAFARYGMATAEELAARDAQVAQQLGVVARGFHESVFDQGERFASELVDFENWLAREYPQYTAKAQPTDTFNYRGTPDDMRQLLGARRSIASWLALDNPVTSPFFRFLGWLTEPMAQQTINADIMAYLNRSLGRYGAKPEEVEKFLGALRSEVQLHQIAGFNLFRGPTGLTANLIGEVASKTLPKNAVEAVGKGEFWKEIDRAFNRMYRSNAAKIARGEAGRLETAVNDLYGYWQNGPVGYGGHFFAKIAYPFLRFFLDPRWWAMNYMEADALGMGRAGWRATRFGTKGIRKETELSVPAGMHAQTAGQGTLSADEAWLWQRQYTGYINKVFDIERMPRLQDALGKTYWDGLKRAWGGTDEQIMGELDRMLYGFDRKGVRQTVNDEAARWLSVEERSDPQMVALIDRVYEINQKTFDDIINVFHGNPNRTTVERLLNSYWLFWPLSYQLKATKWLYDMLTYRAFGKRTNLAGAQVYGQMLDDHREMFATVPAYRAAFEDNPTFWMVAQMLLPITPGDIGVSLSRPVRYTGTYVRNFLGGDSGPLAWWGDYSKAQDPLDTINAITMFGPFYTKDLIDKMSEEAYWQSLWGEASTVDISFDEEEVPTLSQ